MKPKDRDELLARMDERLKQVHEDVNEIKETTRTHDLRIDSLEEKNAKILWHDWAIKGGIASVVGLCAKEIAGLFKHGG